MLKSIEITMLVRQVEGLLATVGIKVDSEPLAAAMKKKGCKESADGRILIPGKLIREYVAAQKPAQKADALDQNLHRFCGIDWAHHLIWHRQQAKIRASLKKQFLMSAFDCGPTGYYDYPSATIQAVDRGVLETMMKFAEATPEIGYTSTWYRSDVPARIERIESLAMSMRWTKKMDGIEAIYPEAIKYLVEASQILTGRRGDTSYLAGSECITPPLWLEKRSAEDILERKRLGVKRYHVASMGTLGVSSPVTVAGSVVLGAAEILGGLMACFAVDPDADLSGRMISMVADMKNANSTTLGPETALCNLAVRELFEAAWGGHCWVEVYLSPAGRRPGLQAVFENFYAAYRTARLLGVTEVPYPGMGVLHSGGVGSPTQFMLDMEIRKAQWFLEKGIEVNAKAIGMEELVEHIRQRKEFLTSEQTVAYCRNLWTSQVFRTDAPSPAWEGTEKTILDHCEEKWRASLAKWTPPDWTEDQLKAMDQLVARAKKEFGVS